MESHAHAMLKRLVAAHLRAEGYLAVAREVRCPGSRYRVDVAGWLDRLPPPRKVNDRDEPTLWAASPGAIPSARTRQCEPRTAVVECKQSRGDFIRDDARAEELIALRAEAEQWRRHLEEHRIKPHEPELRESGSALFPEMETWDFARSRLPAYRRLLKRIRRIEMQLHGETKFCLMARYRVADHLWLAAPRGLIRAVEVPTGWGLLEIPRAWLRRDAACDDKACVTGAALPRPVRVAVAAPQHATKPQQRLRMLRNIAVAASRDALRPQHGVVIEPKPTSEPAPLPVVQSTGPPCADPGDLR